MSVIVTTTDRSRVFFQEGNAEYGPEPAIVITPYNDNILLEQESNTIQLSRHEIPSFIKELQRIVRGEDKK